MAGLTPQGFVKKTLPEIKSEIEQSLRNKFGIFINLLPGSVFQTIVGIFSEREASLWDVAEVLYYSRYPDTSEGVSLEYAVAFNGLRKLSAQPSTIEGVYLFGDDETEVPIGTIFSVQGNPNATFETLTNETLGEGQNAVQDLTFDDTPNAGNFTMSYLEEESAQVNYDDGAQEIEDALNDLSTLSGVVVTGAFPNFSIEFAGDDGKQPHELIEISSNLTEGGNPVNSNVTQSQAGQVQAMVDVVATNDGPTDAPLRALTVIDTPVSGLDRIINTNQVVLGRLEETDSQLRERRNNTIQIAGNSTIDAIVSRLRNVEGVIDVLPFENLTLVTDGDGVPGKAYEMVIDGGDNQDLADTIWDSKPAGIQTFGDIEETTNDINGKERKVYFSRPDEVPIYVSLDITKDASFPANGAGLIQEAIIEWGNGLGIGKNIVIYPGLVSQLSSIDGIIDIDVRIDTSAVSTTPGDPQVNDNIEIDERERSQFSEPNTNVNIL